MRAPSLEPTGADGNEMPGAPKADGNEMLGAPEGDGNEMLGPSAMGGSDGNP